ncbi:HK97 family phage prohead protease [uncultured Roseibium sp.]|uniref:HK97 family phage prohead protease n=1 Tax=uncultured Roseibium sp. TaxID=1936171 RepID=UPI003216D4CB
MPCKHCNDTGSVTIDGVKQPCKHCRPVEYDAWTGNARGKGSAPAKTETKSLTIEKMDGEGQGLARIVDLSAVDSDGDTYLPGAFSWKNGGEQWVPILPAHQRQAMPLGKARIFEDGNFVYADLHLNLETQAGSDWHKTLKFDLEKGTSVQEYSYGFGVLDYAIEQRDGDQVRVLKRLDVHEVSPVIRGAGIGTGTLSMKSHGSFAEQIDAMLAGIDDIIERAGSVKALREGQGRPMSEARLKQLQDLKAKLDGLLAGDPDPAQLDEEKALEEATRLAANFMTRSARLRIG